MASLCVEGVEVSKEVIHCKARYSILIKESSMVKGELRGAG